MTAEIEAKFLANGPEPLDELAATRTLGRASLGAPREVDEVDRYLDTADHRLARELWACRLRERDGASLVSLKGPRQAGDGAWLHRRAELEGPAGPSLDPSSWPPSEARALLDRLRAGLPLVERFSLVQRRTERAVMLDGREVGTLSLDRVTVRAPDGRPAGELQAVELELGPDGRHEALEELAAELARRPGLRPDPRAKLEHAIDLLAR